MNNTKGIGALLAPYTTRAVAQRLGVSTATVTNWRSGRTKPDRQHWGGICILTGLRMHDLIVCINHDEQEGKASAIGKRVQGLCDTDRQTLLRLLVRLESSYPLQASAYGSVANDTETT